jgi:hypothetical protein
LTVPWEVGSAKEYVASPLTLVDREAFGAGFWMTLTLTLLSACGTATAPSQPVPPPPPPPPAPVTPVGTWNVVASANALSCTQATVTLAKSDSIINYNIPGTGVPRDSGLNGSTSRCTTLSPLAAAPITTVRGAFGSNQILLFLFRQNDPLIWYNAQMIFVGTKSDANHVSGNVYSTPAGSGYALGGPIGTWSASK